MSEDDENDDTERETHGIKEKFEDHKLPSRRSLASDWILLINLMLPAFMGLAVCSRIILTLCSNLDIRTNTPLA